MKPRAAMLGLAALLAGMAVHRRRRARLNGRIALVTGGSRGLGFLIARELLEQGCRVAICARSTSDLERAAVRLDGKGRVLPIRCDVTDPQQVLRMVRAVVDEFGRIDILVNNASIIQVGDVDVMDLDDFRHAMDVNFWGTVHTSFAVLPVMRLQNDGVIANVTSIGGRVAVPHLLPYDCAKFAAVGFSEGLRTEVAEHGITVTTIVPGLMRTGSPLNATYRGNPAAEFAWFAAGDLLPITSMSAERAAARIVTAIRRRETDVTLTWQARLLATLHALAPGFTMRVLSLAARLLPSPRRPTEDGRREAVGHTIRSQLPTRYLRRSLARAARTANQ